MASIPPRVFARLEDAARVVFPALGYSSTAAEEAVRDGGSAEIDPRAELVGVLLARVETARADELLTELRRDVTRDRARGAVHWFVGECLE